MIKYRANRRTCQSRGFSLVEVTIALAVISFSCTCLLGLLAVNVTSFHQAMGNTSEADIVQSISNDLRLNSFSILKTYDSTLAGSVTPPIYYYDHEGTLLPDKTGYFYQATLTVSQVTSQNSPTSLDPTVSPATASSPVAAYNIVVTITNAGDNSIYTQQHPHVYSFIVANNGL
jgi:uncharacterized protein (TIGR02598 family)